MVETASPKKNLKTLFEEMQVNQKEYLESFSPTALRNEASRWNAYTDKRFRVLQDERKRLYVFRES